MRYGVVWACQYMGSSRVETTCLVDTPHVLPCSTFLLLNVSTLGDPVFTSLKFDTVYIYGAFFK